ncbi:lipopolysaccharide assembly protein LapA domain-containing protein [Geodermatophilus sp. SYSU D01045]
MVQQQSPGPASTGGTGGAPGSARLSGGVVAALAGGGLLLVFMLQNRQDVTLEFLFWSFTWPLWLFTLVDAFLGAILWLGLGVLRRHRRRVARRAARDD